MDTPQKKRSLFGGITSSLFGRSHTAEPNGTADSDDSLEPHGLRNDRRQRLTPHPSRTVVNASSPESPVKRASDAQLSSRKIIDRPARPSSKLSQSVNAADFASSTAAKKTNFSSLAASTTAPKPSGALVRMPGDNPNKFNTVSGSTLSRSTRPVVDFSGTATTPRNLFRGSTLNGRPGPSFSPKVPYNLMKESFPPSTPGRPPRYATAEVNGRALAHTNTSALFDMRIPSPPRELTGERLAKEVPEDKNRVGSVYADEFLAHYCPPDFDDLQRRQFFCVLDLRRLKFAADEIFTKKDWKINILNFAKEYEKSRSLIMLRYGLYEFKTVRASEAVKKQWQKDHGIAGSDDESEVQTYKSTGAQSTLGRGKRKAEEELGPKDTALTASSSNLNKRRVTEPEPRAEATTPAPTKNKRKADAVGEPDENPPSKLQKAAPASQKASATKSIFERIANGASNDTSPSLKPKPAPSALFGATKPATANGGRSVFEQPSKTPSNNIFGHLSDASKASNDDADSDSEGEGGDETASDADGEAEESEPQDASQSDEPSGVASGSAGTPHFGAAGLFAKKAATEAPSNTSSEAGDSTKARSLFDRVTYGSDGQPVRVFGQTAPQPASPEKDKPAGTAQAQTSTPTKTTWSTDTPIKFAPTSSQSSAVFGSGTPKTGSIFAPKETPKPAAAPAITLEPPTPSKAPEPPMEADKPAAPAEEPKPASASQPQFGAKSSAPAAGTSPFASGSTPVFGFGLPPASVSQGAGEAKPAEKQSAAPPSGAGLFFGAKPATTGSETPKPTASPFFGAKPATSETEASTPTPTASSIFGVKPANSETQTSAPASAVFGAKSPQPESDASKPAASPFFGAKPATSEEAAKSASSIFGAKPATSEEAAKSAPSLFGPKPAASTSEPSAPASVFQSTNLFGTVTKADEPKPASAGSLLFGSSAKPAEAPAAPAVGFTFGATAAPSSTAGSTAASTKPLFGTTPTQSTSIFSGLNGSTPATTAETKPASTSFGATPATSGTLTAKPLFGAAPSTEAEPKQPASIFANPFGGNTAAATESPFKFGQSQSTAPAASFGSQQQNTQSTAPLFGGSATSSFTFATGGGQQSFNNPFANATNGSSSAPPSFNFGGNTAADNNNASQPSATPFSFGAGNVQAPTISFGGGSGASTPGAQPGNSFGGGANGATPSFGSNFAFSGSQSQPNAGNIFAPQPSGAGGSIFAGLAPVGGTSTGTNSPFTFGGASSLATTPATGTPEPGAAAEQEDGQGSKADGDDAPQEQISLTDGGPGEEDESVVHEVRAKALKLVVGGESDGEETSSGGDKNKAGGGGAEGGGGGGDKKKANNPWKTQGVGPLRLMKHKTTGAVRMLLRAEPRGHVALNKRVLPDFTYKPEMKYVKITTSNDAGSGLETWMLQVKTKELATALAEALETHKLANKKK